MRKGKKRRTDRRFGMLRGISSGIGDGGGGNLLRTGISHGGVASENTDFANEFLAVSEFVHTKHFHIILR